MDPSTRGHRVDGVVRATRACHLLSGRGVFYRGFPLRIGTRRRPWNVHFRRSIGISPRQFREGIRLPERPLWADGARRMAARRDCDRAARMEARHRRNCVAAYNQ